MEKEYLFKYDSVMEFPLDESIETLSKLYEGNYLISNVKTPYAEVYAPEINFYINHSKDNLADKIKNVKKLYDIRLAAYESAEDWIELFEKILVIEGFYKYKLEVIDDEV